MNRSTANLWLGLIQVLMIASIPAPSFAQAVESLTAGTRIRVKTTAPNEWRVGYIKSVDSSAIVLTPRSISENKATPAEAAHPWTLPLASVSRVEISRGRGPRTARTIAGAVLGGISGGLLLFVIGDRATQCTNCDSSGIGGIAGPLFGLPIGLALGAIIGFATTRERWEPVSVSGARGPGKK
jgi:hypothetical protein